MKARTASRLAWVAFGFGTLCFVGSLVFHVLTATGPNPEWGEIVGSGLLGLGMFAFPVVGVLIASRQPGNAIGWILLAIGLVWELVPLTENYVEYGLVTNPGSLPRPDLVVVLTSSSWVPGIGLIGTFLLLLFPDGRLPSRRWRPLAWLSGLTLTFLTLVMPLLPAPMSELGQDPSLGNAPNPLGIEALRPVLDRIFVIGLLVPACIVGCALSLIARFRRSRGQERLQLKWLAAGAGLTAAIFLVTMVASLFFGGEIWADQVTPVWVSALQWVSIYSFVLIPVAIGIAVLKYRLYDIDVIINRTLVYGTLTVALALVYTGGVVGLGAVARGVTQQETNNLAVATSTLAVAALFRPLRRHVQSFIDRRFYRHKYDAEQTLADFSARLRDQLDLDSLNAELVGVVTRTMQPSRVSLWLKPPPP